MYLSAKQLEEVYGPIGESQEPSPDLNGKKSKCLCDQVIDYVLQCDMEELRTISLAKLLRKFAVSKMYLNRCFREFSHETPGKFIFREKMERAKAMMQNNRKTAAEISDLLGFSSVNYFVRIFKRHFGKPPREYFIIRASQARDYGD